MTYYENVATFEREGFLIRFDVTPEQDDPRGYFASGDDAADQEIIDQISDGSLAWFVARVTASKHGLVLGSDYLGGCCYDSPEAFMREKGGYFDDMIANAIDMARDAIARIKQGDE